jgi:hypothetical protein
VAVFALVALGARVSKRLRPAPAVAAIAGERVLGHGPVPELVPAGPR